MGILSKLRLLKKKKKKNKEYKYLGESPLEPIYKKIAEDINEHLKLGLIRLTRMDNHISVDVIDPVGMAIWYNNKYNMLTKGQLKLLDKEVLKETQKEWWEREYQHNPIEDIKAIEKESEKYYNPLGKVKLTEVMKKRLFSSRESIDED